LATNIPLSKSSTFWATGIPVNVEDEDEYEEEEDVEDDENRVFWVVMIRTMALTFVLSYDHESAPPSSDALPPPEDDDDDEEEDEDAPDDEDDDDEGATAAFPPICLRKVFFSASVRIPQLAR
jgi:hypothetical protein